MPGIQATGANGVIETISFHRSHLPFMPSLVRELVLAGAAEWQVAKALDLDRQLGLRGVKLKPYQREDLPRILGQRGTLLGYEMRVGKTPLATAAHDPADGILVVVGPLASREVWREWIERVHGDPPYVLRGVKDTELWGGYGSYWLNYEIAEAWTQFFVRQKIGTLIFDEIHIMQSRKSRRYQAMCVLAARASRLIGLTGTPLWSDPASLYPALHLVTPGAWSSFHDFGQRYTRASPSSRGWVYSGRNDQHTYELSTRLERVMIRRTWESVLGHLPPITRVVEIVAVPPEVASRIDLEVSEAILIAGGGGTVAGYLSTMRRKLSAFKVKAAVEAATRTMLDGHKCVVWYWHNELGDALAVELKRHRRGRAGLDLAPVRPVFRLREGQSQNLRAEQIEKFRAEPGPAVMIAGLAIAGVAIDLSCATHSVHAEISTLPVYNQQAEMRTFRPDRPSCAVYLAADVPLEIRLIEILGVREGHQKALGLGEEQIAKLVLER